ncbi:lysyl oxidase homolog 2B-like [Ctenocephalides felis]|uniref:lysyl oxidase homolog 2B-like n=1 Tax=Ctenocephalides felis TaxID=7515 RepID=UPI000E6E4CD7|nr:lysyl oxidase homolog 2B-like [Ctenocephalides felis]
MSGNEKSLPIRVGSGPWGTVCGDGWSLLEGAVICRQLGFGYANDALQTDFFGNGNGSMLLSGIKCHGNEPDITHCLHDTIGNVTCPGLKGHVAGVTCIDQLPDLVIDHIELERTAHLEDKPMFYLQCAMEENCLGSQAYVIQRQNDAWHLETRRLLRFTARVLNAGTADFRPSIPKHLWEWHMCHRHYHSMEVFATFDIINSEGRRVAEGHKASFCLEDNLCIPGVKPRYACANYGDQGISVNCSDIYRYNIDCQWVDISELKPGIYRMKVSVNPEFKVAEITFDNNAAVCELIYTETYARLFNCRVERP